MMKNKEREPGYYWVTYEDDRRVLAQWDGRWWYFCGTDNMEKGGSEYVTNINEKRIVEDDKDTLDT